MSKPIQSQVHNADQAVFADKTSPLEDKVADTSNIEAVPPPKNTADTPEFEFPKMTKKVVIKTYQRRKKGEASMKITNAKQLGSTHDTARETSKQGSDLTLSEANEIINKFVASLDIATDMHVGPSAAFHTTESFTEGGRDSHVDNVLSSRLYGPPQHQHDGDSTQPAEVTTPTRIGPVDAKVCPVDAPATQIPEATHEVSLDAQVTNPIVVATMQPEQMSIKTKFESLNKSLTKHMDENSKELRRYFKRKMKAMKKTFRKKFRRLKELVLNEGNYENHSAANHAPQDQNLHNLSAQ